MQRLNIIGCGHVAGPIGRLLSEQGLFEMGDVLCRSRESASRGVAFIHSGQAVDALGAMRRADVFMLGVGDDHIRACARDLARSGLVAPGNIVFHFSGSLPSSELDSLKQHGVMTASVHPLKSFADPERSYRTFAGTLCGIEGDAAAVHVLTRVFEEIGGRVVPIDATNKDIYHAASVFVCNYVTALLDVGLRCYMKAGLDRETAREIMAPLVRDTVENVLRMGTVKGLSGPVARGDHGVVAREMDALNRWEPDLGELYRRLGSIALDLSTLQGNAPEASLEVLRDTLASREVDADV
ncbi:Rossmann-like and DUF2520 domain-containing protein [Desulfoplanes sp.]